MKHPRLRDGRRLQTNEPYPINQLPDDLLVKIGGYLVHLLYVGRKDISGGDWGDAFADSIGGKHLDSPVGIADVVLGKMAWSMKTVKNNNPFSASTVCIYEEENHRYATNEFRWDVNSNGNLIGKSIETDETCFTWQPHGSQFTIHSKVPKNAVKFRIKRPPMLSKEDILRTINFDSSWVDIIR